MTNRFGDRGKVSSLDISTRNGERFPRRIPRANLSETSPRDPKERDIYRADLKYKVAAPGGWKNLGIVPIFWKIAVTTWNSNHALGSCLEIQRPRGKNVTRTRKAEDSNASRRQPPTSSLPSCPMMFVSTFSPSFTPIGIDFLFRRTRRHASFLPPLIENFVSNFHPVWIYFRRNVALYRDETNVTTFHSFRRFTPSIFSPLRNKHPFYHIHVSLLLPRPLSLTFAAFEIVAPFTAPVVTTPATWDRGCNSRGQVSSIGESRKWRSYK